MRAFRLCRSTYPPYDGEGARRAGGRWNSKGTRVLYLSENRSLAVLEILVHLSGILPDKYLSGSADIPDNLPIERIVDEDLPETWSTLIPAEQVATRRLGDAWVERQRSAILSVPSIIVGERNYVLNPAHPDFARIAFAEPEPFRFDQRLISAEERQMSEKTPRQGPV
jgi:RES domain-containing protein